MSIQLKSVEFGLKDNPRSPLAPTGFRRGTKRLAAGFWKKKFRNPEESPLIVMHALLPDEGFTVKPVLRCTANETTVRLEVSCEQSTIPAIPGATGNRVSDADFAKSLSGISGVNIDFGPDGIGENPTPLPFDDFKPAKAVECRDIVFKWRDAITGSDIADTKHRLYVILGAPVLPWSADPIDRKRWLWPEVLDFACTWAAGATTANEAAQKIIEAVCALGNQDERKGGLRYKNQTFVTDSFFDCAKFLDHLAGTVPNSSVDCTDLASIVSTFANAVGCHLYQARCSGGNLNNTVRLIGQSGAPDPPLFGFHEMVWDGYASDTDNVWDACLSLGSQAPIAAQPFAQYGLNVFTAAPLTTGPPYASNRSLTPRAPVALTSRTQAIAQDRHPNLTPVIGQQTAQVRDMTDTAKRLSKIKFEPASRIVEGETAHVARIEQETGIAELRLSEFASGEAARRYLLYRTQCVPERLVEWQLPRELPSEMFGGAPLAACTDPPDRPRTILVQIGTAVLMARISVGNPALESVVADILSDLARL